MKQNSWLFTTLDNNLETSKLRPPSLSAPPGSTKSNNSKDEKHKKKKKQNQKQQKAKSITARSVALSALIQSSSTSSSAVERLTMHPYYAQIPDRRDRAFARVLVTTVERRMGQIDKVLKKCAKVYPPKKGKHAALVQASLRLGAAQLLFLETAPHAAVSETLNAMRSCAALKQQRLPTPMIQFVNAVLRTLTQKGSSLLHTETSLSDNLAPWLWNNMTAAWGKDAALAMVQTCLLGPANNGGASLLQQPCLDLSTVHSYNKDNAEMDRLRQAFGEEAVLLPHGTIRVRPGRRKESESGSVNGGGASLHDSASPSTSAVQDLPQYKDGTWWVQDAAAAVPALALMHALEKQGTATTTPVDSDVPSIDQEQEEPNQNRLGSMHVVDVCAAPGGKTAQLLSAQFGSVTAVEKSQRRVKRLKENLQRLGFGFKVVTNKEEASQEDVDASHGEASVSAESGCNVIIADARHWLPQTSFLPEKVDGILLDAPCSATGTARRRPDVFQKDPTTIFPSLLDTQQELLQHCFHNVLSKGGILVYATCSVLPQEGEEQIIKFCQSCGGDEVVEQVKFTKGEIPGFDAAIDEKHGWLRILPGMLTGELEECDGFFVARLRKKA